jgi:SAM-dependent methyltransferase
MDMLCGDKMNLNFIDNWKDNEIVFQKQLELNKFQLSNSLNYPDHWIADLKLLQLIKFNKCLELGCGVGAFSQFLKYNFSEVDYLGYDYSEVAINFAKTTWESPDKFILKNLHDVTCEDTSGFDLIYISGVVDCTAVLQTLLERELIEMRGRSELPGHPVIYGTTQKFMEWFSINDLNDLPPLAEMEALNRGAEQGADNLLGLLTKDEGFVAESIQEIDDTLKGVSKFELVDPFEKKEEILSEENGSAIPGGDESPTHEAQP